MDDETMVKLNEILTDDETMVRYVHFQEPHPEQREQLIAYYCIMWTVDREKEFFHRGIVTKTDSFKDRDIWPKAKAFTIHFNFTSLIGWTIHNALGKCSRHLTIQTYTLYATTLINLSSDTETTNEHRRTFLSHWVPITTLSFGASP